MVDAQVVARFTTTPAEMVEAVKTLSGALYGFKAFSRGQGLWRAVLYFVVGSFAVFLVLTVVSDIAQRYTSLSHRDISLIVGGALAMAWVLLIGFGRFQMRRVRAALAGTPAEENVEILADDAGLWWVTASERHFWSYSKFERVLAFKGGFNLVTGLSGAFVPGRAFSSAAEREAFEALLRGKLRAEALSPFFAANASGSR